MIEVITKTVFIATHEQKKLMHECTHAQTGATQYDPNDNSRALKVNTQQFLHVQPMT